jgi:hypothetical protein
MTTIEITETTTATPEQFLAALTDFGPKRSEIWGNSKDQFLKVHDRGEDWADVTEGSAGVWERLRYDWSNPLDIVLTTTDSNAWGGKSGHRYTLTPGSDGTTTVHMVVVREGIHVRGRLLGALLPLVGRSFIGKGLRGALRATEARAGEPPA